MGSRQTPSRAVEGKEEAPAEKTVLGEYARVLEEDGWKVSIDRNWVTGKKNGYDMGAQVFEMPGGYGIIPFSHISRFWLRKPSGEYIAEYDRGAMDHYPTNIDEDMEMFDHLLYLEEVANKAVRGEGNWEATWVPREASRRVAGLDVRAMVDRVLSRVAPGLPKGRLEALADSIISDLDLDGVMGEVAEARNLGGIRSDLQRDPQVMYIDISGDSDTEALEQFLFGM